MKLIRQLILFATILIAVAVGTETEKAEKSPVYEKPFINRNDTVKYFLNFL
jgi:hypothetical protein